MIEIYNIIGEYIKKLFYINKNDRDFCKLIDKIKKEQMILFKKEKGEREYYSDGYHNWDYLYHIRCEDAIKQEALKLIEELDLTYYFEDDAMGAQFYIIYKNGVSIGSNTKYYGTKETDFSQQESFLYFLFKYKENLKNN